MTAITATATVSGTVAEVQRRLRELAWRLGAADGPQARADRAMAQAVLGFLDRIAGRGSQPAVDGIVALPLLVHGAYTGDPGPAAPAAMAHLLWWVSARYLDDLSDAEAGPAAAICGPRGGSGTADGLGEKADRMLLSIVDLACHLSGAVLDAACPGDPARALRLRQELSRCWHNAIAGQLADLTANPAATTPEEVLASYRGKTGAPYAMSAAMAAVLAGCDAYRVDEWRWFGERFGVLRQLLNDRRDLATGRNEDLRNAAATYMLVHYLGSLPAAERPAAEKLLAECAGSSSARERLAARLTGAENLRDLAASVRPLIDALHASVDALGGRPEFGAGLHALIDETANLCPLPATA